MKGIALLVLPLSLAAAQAGPVANPGFGGSLVLPSATFSLTISGRRLGEIPLNFDPASGTLRFSARTDYDPSAATFLYEIVRQPREPS